MKVVSSWITHIWKYKILFLLGFFFIFFLTGYVGTTTFNYYCVQQKIPDYLRGGLFGFEHCIINTLTIDGITFWLSLFCISFFFQTYLFYHNRGKHIRKVIIHVFLSTLLYIFLFYLLSYFLPTLFWGFWQEGTVVTVKKGFLTTLDLSTMPSFYVFLFLYIASQISLLLFALYLHIFKKVPITQGVKYFTGIFLYFCMFQLTSMIGIAFLYISLFGLFYPKMKRLPCQKIYSQQYGVVTLMNGDCR